MLCIEKMRLLEWVMFARVQLYALTKFVVCLECLYAMPGLMLCKYLIHGMLVY